MHRAIKSASATSEEGGGTGMQQQGPCLPVVLTHPGSLACVRKSEENGRAATKSVGAKIGVDVTRGWILSILAGCVKATLLFRERVQKQKDKEVCIYALRGAFWLLS